MKQHSVQLSVPHTLSIVVGEILRKEAMIHPFFDWEGHEKTGEFLLLVPNHPQFSASLIHRLTCMFHQADIAFMLKPSASPMQV